MKDHVKYGRARDQIYHYIVLQRQMHDSIPTKRRTPELLQLLEMAEALAHTIAEALEANQIVAMQLDRYDVLALPGIFEQLPEMKNPYQGDTD